MRRLQNDSYELIAGERRLRAARIVGICRVPCIVMDVSDERSAVLALIENVQRQNLDFFEEADAILQIMLQYDLTQEDVAAQLGKAPSTVCNKLRLLRLPKEVRCEIIRTNLSERHARALLRLDSSEQMLEALERIVRQNLNAAQTEMYITQLLHPPTPERRKPILVFKDIRLFVNTLNHAVDLSLIHI